MREITGREVFEIRTRLGHTQESFADLLGVSRATINNWERGKAKLLGPAQRLVQLLDQATPLVNSVTP